MTAGAYRLTSPVSVVELAGPPVGKVMYCIINPPDLEIYLALSKACGMQRSGSACSHLDPVKGLKSGRFFKQLPLNMDGRAANA